MKRTAKLIEGGDFCIRRLYRRGQTLIGIIGGETRIAYGNGICGLFQFNVYCAGGGQVELEPDGPLIIAGRDQ